MVPKRSAEKTVREIKRRIHREYSAEEKIRIIFDGLRDETSIAELCRREGIHQNIYYKWSRDFLEAGKKRLGGDTMRETNTKIRQENMHLKQLMADIALKHFNKKYKTVVKNLPSPRNWMKSVHIDFSVIYE
ncbi:MAG: transposase [Candidatus Marinimicrobia bacterium]|nr:transposase [Candidatus Neomarinimicrobiota bacterium]